MTLIEAKRIFFFILIRTLVTVPLLFLNVNLCLATEEIPVSTGEWAPYTSKEMEGYGFFSQIVTATFKEAGIEISYSFYPWKRCAAYIKSGDNFAAFPYSVTDERKSFAYFSDPVSESTTVFFYNNKNHNNPINYESLNDLEPYSIVGVLGYFYSEIFQKASMDINFVRTETKALSLIFRKRYDLLPINYFVGWNLIKKNFPDNLQAFSTCKTPLSTNTLHLMASKRYPNSQSLINRFNEALIRIKKKGIYHKIVSLHSPGLQAEIK